MYFCIYLYIYVPIYLSIYLSLYLSISISLIFSLILFSLTLSFCPLLLPPNQAYFRRHRVCVTLPPVRLLIKDFFLLIHLLLLPFSDIVPLLRLFLNFFV